MIISDNYITSIENITCYKSYKSPPIRSEIDLMILFPLYEIYDFNLFDSNELVGDSLIKNPDKLNNILRFS